MNTAMYFQSARGDKCCLASIKVAIEVFFLYMELLVHFKMILSLETCVATIKVAIELFFAVSKFVFEQRP